jgi:cytochrome c oxidase subunit 4
MSQHIVPKSTYYTVFAALLVLLALTLGAYYINLGPLNLTVALLIAATKAVLILLFFMHVKYSSKMVMLFSGVAFIFLFIMLAMTASDYFTRGWIPVTGR